MHSSRMRTAALPPTETPLDKDAHGQRPSSPRQRPPPPDGNPLEKDSPGQRPLWTETSVDREIPVKILPYP